MFPVGWGFFSAVAHFLRSNFCVSVQRSFFVVVSVPSAYFVQGFTELAFCCSFFARRRCYSVCLFCDMLIGILAMDFS